MGLLMILPVQVQLAERILGVPVSGFSGLGKVLYRFGSVPLYDFASEILLAQLVGGAVTPMVGGVLQPLDSQLSIMHFRIVGEVQFTQSILRRHMTLSGRLIEPVLGFDTIWNQNRAILVESANKILRVSITLFGHVQELSCRFISVCHWSSVILCDYPQRPAVI